MPIETDLRVITLRSHSAPHLHNRRRILALVAENTAPHAPPKYAFVTVQSLWFLCAREPCVHACTPALAWLRASEDTGVCLQSPAIEKRSCCLRICTAYTYT